MKKKSVKSFYKYFPSKCSKFNNEIRAVCYIRAKELIDKVRGSRKWHMKEETIDAIIILLFCWNFATPITKRLKRNRIIKLLTKTCNNLSSLENYCIVDNNWVEKELIIKNVYNKFKTVFGQTGASKVLSLLNPKLFMMWDTG